MLNVISSTNSRLISARSFFVVTVVVGSIFELNLPLLCDSCIPSQANFVRSFDVLFAAVVAGWLTICPAWDVVVGRSRSALAAQIWPGPVWHSQWPSSSFRWAWRLSKRRWPRPHRLRPPSRPANDCWPKRRLLLPQPAIRSDNAAPITLLHAPSERSPLPRNSSPTHPAWLAMYQSMLLPLIPVFF